MRTWATYSIIVAGSALLVLNPVAIHLTTGLRSLAAYTAFLDLWLVLIIGAGIVYLRGGRRLFAGLLIGAIATLLPAMFVAEVALVLVRHGYGDRLLGDVPEIFQPDPELIYTLIPGAQDQHTSLGNFDVVYVIDDAGRKAIPSNGDAARHLHVFGDSFTFGFGVANEDTWPNLLDDRLGDDVDVLNYGVIGYSLEQMLLSLERNRERVAPGDLVLFTPMSDDLARSLAGRAYVCGGQIRSEGNEMFPVLEENGGWRMADLADECSFLFDTVLANSPLPIGFGALYRTWRSEGNHQQMIDNAERIFARAEAVAEERGASFELVFIATPDECAAGRLAFDLSALERSWTSLLPACPAGRDEAQALRFPFDGHWNPKGHAWAAEAVFEALRTSPDDGGRQFLAARG
jgi:hypothetical protein